MNPSIFLPLVLLLAVSHALDLSKISRIIQEQNKVRTKTIRHNQTLLALLSQSGQFFSLDDFLDVFDTDEDGSVSSNCAEDLRALISARLGNSEYPEFAEQVWLPIIDSSGKIAPAILKGHVYFAGHYSECVQVDARLTGRERPFTADYFKVYVDVLFRSKANNGSCAKSGQWSDLPGREFGICLLASCSSAELESRFLDDSTQHNPVCSIHRTNDSLSDWGAGFYVTISIMGAILALCCLSGAADFFFSDFLVDKPSSRNMIRLLFMNFSLYSNVASIFNTSGSNKEGQIDPIHCIRFFSMCWVVLGHLCLMIMAVSANAGDFFALTQDVTTEMILNAFFSVDSFFFIGGLLLTFLWFKNYHRNPKQTNSPGAWLMIYVHRILRLSPPYFMMVLFSTFVLPQLYRNSPFNMNFMTQMDDCEHTWWLEFTYLHNIINSKKQCLGYSWYLATDMQIFFFSPLLIIPLALKPVIGFIVAGVLLALSSAVNIFLVYYYHWTATLQVITAHDPEMTNFSDYMTYMYMSPITRCQVYIIGMLVGWLLQTNKQMRINPIMNIALWIATVALMLTLILGLHSQTIGQLIPIFWRAMYSAFSKPAWALALSWIIVSCYYGYGVNDMLGLVIHTIEVITRLIPIIILTYFFSIFWSACFAISFGKMEMLLLGGLRLKDKSGEPALIEQKPSKIDVERSEESVDFKIRL